MTGAVSLAVDGAVGTILIDSPAKRNSFTLGMVDELHEAARGVAANPGIRVVILRGAGSAAFSAGMDFDSLTEGDDIAGRFALADQKMERAAAALRAVEVPIVAALRGACIGGGVHVALTADIRFAADDLAFGIPAVSLGIIYPLDALATLVTLGGAGAAKTLLLEGRPIDAARALALGYVDRVVPAGEFDAALAAFVGRIAEQPAATVRAYKRIIDNLAAGAPLGASVAVRDALNRSDDLIARLEAVRRQRGAKRGR
ncbi:MAG TPA: enoyl-CoA hydratase/isomerase family protein [Alphaproteobacteria bacterium]|jgi:enoyl-CoA hydratase/carnithine racemase|nr:enoyl-CoA hydratase/isomerase family protein [Alphaproteobacteria bacterium]